MYSGYNISVNGASSTRTSFKQVVWGQLSKKEDEWPRSYVGEEERKEYLQLYPLPSPLSSITSISVQLPGSSTTAAHWAGVYIQVEGMEALHVGSLSVVNKVVDISIPDFFKLLRPGQEAEIRIKDDEPCAAWKEGGSLFEQINNELAEEWRMRVMSILGDILRANPSAQNSKPTREEFRALMMSAWTRPDGQRDVFKKLVGSLDSLNL